MDPRSRDGRISRRSSDVAVNWTAQIPDFFLMLDAKTASALKKDHHKSTLQEESLSGGARRRRCKTDFSVGDRLLFRSTNASELLAHMKLSLIVQVRYSSLLSTKE